MTRSLLALTLATAATLGLSLTAAPASAGTETLYLGAGVFDRYGEFQAEGLTNVNVQVYQEGPVWRASVFRRVERQDPVTRVFHAVTEKTAGRAALVLPAGAVTVSGSEHTITVAEVDVPIERTVSSSSFSGITSQTTQETTTLQGTFQIAGGRTGPFNESFTFTPQFGCESADHYEDTKRKAAATVRALGTDLVVEQGNDKERTSEALFTTFRLRGTENC